jgi:hypothetical protein
MPAYEYCSDRGECFDRIFYHWSDAPETIVEDSLIYRRQFPNPAVRFKGPFSGSTKNMLFPDDGSVYEAGTKKDQKNKKRYVEEEREKARTDFLRKQVQEYDV